MADAITDTIQTADEATEIGGQPALDYFNAHILMPVGKLDADQYSAEDIDGGTEGVFGSGTLNYLLLQGSQTDQGAMVSETAQQAAGIDLSVGSHPALTFSPSLSGDASSASPYQTNGDHSVISADQGAIRNTDGGAAGGYGGHGYPAATGMADHSDTFTAGKFLTPVNGAHGLDGFDGESYPAPRDGADGTSGTNGVNGTDGGDGTGGGTTIIDIDVDLGDIDLGDLINLGDLIDINIGDINLGDLININLGDINFGDLVNITEIVNNLTGNVTNIVNNITNNVTDIVDNILGGDGGLTITLDGLLSGVSELGLGLDSGDLSLDLVNEVIDLTPVTDLLDGIIDLDNIAPLDIHTVLSILDGQPEHSPGDTDLGIGLFGTAEGLDILGGVTDVVLDPIEDLVGDIDILADLGLDLFQVDDSPDDSDISGDLDLELAGTELLSIDGIDLPLDPLEALVGDIDLDLGVASNILGDMADGLVDMFSGGTEGGNILSSLGDDLSSLSGNLGLGSDNGDTDAGLSAGGQIAGFDVSTGAIDLLLNPVEDVAGDLDLAGTLGFDILGDSEIDNAAGDSDITVDLGLELAGADIPLVGDIGEIDIPLDPVEAIVGDIDLDLGGAANVLGDAAGEVVDALPGGTGGDGILATVGGDLSDLAAGLGLGEADPANGDTDIAVDSGIAGVDLPLGDVGLALDPVEDIAGDVDLAAGTSFDLLGDSETDNAAGDTDLHIGIDLGILDQDLTGDQGFDIPLDPVEAITGDIDLDLGAGVNLLGDIAEGPVDDLPGGSADDTALSQIGDGLSDLAEDVLAGDPASGLEDVASSAIAAVDDIAAAVDDFGGDVTDLLDGDIGSALDLLDSGGDMGDVGDLVDGIMSWPESTVSDLGGALTGDVGGDDSLGGLLPDPVGSVAEGLGGLFGGEQDTSSAQGSGHSGGLFGGLFG